MEKIRNIYATWLFERGTKTPSGAVEFSYERQFSPRIFATSTDRCPVRLLKSYMFDHRPQEMQKPNDPFYLAIIRSPKWSVWYKKQPLEEHSLGSLMKSMAIAAKLEGRKVNHSGCHSTNSIEAGRCSSSRYMSAVRPQETKDPR